MFEADPAHGTVMGNRGCLVNASGDLVRRWQVERWITCVLEFKGRRRHPLMAPGRYTELFFLDEATACAAGHRPCHECRRADANTFLEAWCELHPRDTRLSEVDARLHEQRTRGAHYRADRRAWPAQRVSVLTPPSILAAIRAGWRPGVHPSARP